MAKSSVQIPALCSQLAEDARRGVFKPVYLLMGDEPYYPDLVCDAVMANCVEEGFKDLILISIMKYVKDPFRGG